MTWLAGPGPAAVILQCRRTSLRFPTHAVLRVFVVSTTLTIAGCGSPSFRVGTRPSASSANGSVHGGQQPIVGANIQLYAAGTAGDGSASTPLLTRTILSDSSGAFSFGGFYTCPSLSSLVYLVSIGGNPGLYEGTSNGALTLMAALGPCGDLGPSSFVTINELTTASAVSALSPFMQATDRVGAGVGNQQLLNDAFTTAGYLVDVSSGSTPGNYLPGQTIPVLKVQTLGDVLASCANSASGGSDDQSACNLLFTLSTTPGQAPPTDITGSMLGIARNPVRNVLPLYRLSPPQAPFRPTLASAPDSWALDITSSTLAPSFRPLPGIYSSALPVTLSDADPSARIFYTTDGSTPSSSSIPYTGAIVLPASGTIRAVAVVNGISSILALGVYTIAPAPAAKLVFLAQPGNSAVAGIIAPAPVVAVEDANNFVVTAAQGPVTVQIAGNPGAGTLTGTTTVNAVNGLAIFDALSIDKAGNGYTLQAVLAGVTSTISNAFTISNTVTLSLSSNPLAVGSTGTATLHLSAPASEGGLVAAIASSDPSVLSVSTSSVTFSPGTTTAIFSFAAGANGAADLTVAIPGLTGATAHVVSNAPVIPSNFFGMTIQNFEVVEPLVSFGTTRSWDAFVSFWDNSPGLDWPHISPSAGVYNFAAVDSFITINQARGVDMIYTFGRTPQWASSSPNAPGIYGPGQCAPPAKLADWDAFVTAIASHANGRIKYWEVWNEPTYPQSYCGDLATMVTLAQHASQIIKSIDPSAVILSPSGTDTNGPVWLDSYFAAGGAAYTDIVTFHGYWSTTAEDINTVVASYRAVAAKYYLGSKPIWDTEASWAGLGGGASGLTDPSQRAAFLAKYYLLQWSAGVSRFLWYAYDGQPIWGQLWDSTNQLHTDGAAYQETFDWLVGASMKTPCAEDNSGTWTCVLTRQGGYQAEVVWNSGGSRSFVVAPNYTEFLDLQGFTHPVTRSTVTAANQPILLQTGPLP